MGESIVGALKDENKMGESAASDDVLEVSVSFGRFENDSSLSWEKWSSFSPNKYLEEVEKCSTPGSVAQKKAYFEAHYKKIAARKAELLDLEKQMGTDPLGSDDPNCGDQIRNTDGNNTEFDVSNGQSSAEGVDQDTNLISVVTTTHVDEPSESNEGAPITIERQSSSVEEAEEELDSKQDYLANKERKTASVMKKAVSPIAKSPQISKPRDSKPTPTSKMISSSQPSIKKANGSSLPKSKNPSAGEIKKPSPRSKIPSAGEWKKVAPTSLHMSLSLGPPHSDSASLTTTRKSLIMEKMGDKDIVRRAFKTFQNSFNQLKPSSEVRSSVPKQVSAKSTEPRVSTSITTQRDKERPLKAGVVDQKNTKTAPTFGLRSNERAEKRKEFFKKLEEKSNAKQTEKTRLQSKSKEQKEVEIKKLRQSLNFKATPMPGFYQGQRTSKSNLNKVCASSILPD
ncbi:Protein WVD2-like 6 [Vitis vinifera]|uniref:Protein WVD2-like 6 n=1 Tax=Vitis vinifera TaxID=29760 RepID=A0A438JNJ5_VITVI|nr:Protein WVD2-like 6 [Vitis vinifera]